MAVQLFKKAETFAKSLISQDKINDTASWSFSADDGNKLLGSDGDDWENYAKWHLGKDTDANKETKAYYKYPFGKNGKVYMSGLRAIRTRAAQAGATTVFDAAGRLMDAAKKKLEKRGIKMKQTRAYYVPEKWQVRAVGGEDDSEGIFEGYAVVWDSVDSHGTRFKKGSFKKTLQERSDRIKILYNHDTDEPIGKPLEIKEDNVGLFVRGQLTAGVKRADETALNIQAEVVDTLSIGFTTLQDKPQGQFRDITEVKLYEFSPVTFASNEKAKITGFRSEEFTEPDNDPIQPADNGAPGSETREGNQPENQDDGPNIPQLTRDTDYNETLKGEELYERGWILRSALSITLSDIWWSDMDNDEIIAAFDAALADFHTQYLIWAKEFIGNFWEQRFAIMADKELASVFNLEMRKAEKTIESLAAETSFTADELRTLSRGNLLPLESRNKLAELPELIGVAHQEKRKMAVEELCDELRLGQFTKAEATRFRSLLDLNDKETESETRAFSSIQASLKKLRESVND